MKKIITAIILAALVLSLCACGSTAAPAEQAAPEAPAAQETGAPEEKVEEEPSAFAGLANPIHECSAQELVDATGITFNIPLKAEDVRYSYIDGDPYPISQAQFILNGTECVLRALPSDIPDGEPEDISGLYYTWSTNEECVVRDQPAWVHCNDRENGYVTWYDFLTGITYNVSVSSEASAKELGDFANIVCPLLQGESDAYDIYAGDSMPAEVPIGCPFFCDLNGDGTDELISVGREAADVFGNCINYISIDGGNGAASKVFFTGITYGGRIFLADLNGDGLIELLMSGDVMSDDYFTYIINYNKDKEIVSLINGDIDCVAGCVEKIEGNEVTLSDHIYVLGTYGGERNYCFDASGEFNPVESSVWSFTNNETELEVISALPVTFSDGAKGELPAGSKIILTSYDGIAIAAFKTADGKEGTIEYEVINAADCRIAGKDESGYFAYLPYAG